VLHEVSSILLSLAPCEQDQAMLHRRTSFAGSLALASDDERDEEITGDDLWDDEQAAKARNTCTVVRSDPNILWFP